MRKSFLLILLCLMLPLAASAHQGLSRAQRRQGEMEAKAVIDRFTGKGMKVKVSLSLSEDANGCQRYICSVRDNVLTIRATDGVAACRGFYDYIKKKGAGIAAWSGNRFSAPFDMYCQEMSLTSAYRYHQYFNVVTYGYTAPFWDEARWDRELDWMALHGINMPLLLLAQEQIYREVFLDMGLTDEEIDEWETGPAHLPWMRMGNISGNSFDGPLGKEWNERQVRLCRHVISRMRRLGMKPICPAFGGFVPKSFVRHYEGSVDCTGWNWVPAEARNYRLNPSSKAFAEVGTRFIRKWEEKFGKCEFYLSDSFNEMEIPKDRALIQSYGEAIYRSIRDANPDAVWVMQGWTLGFQRKDWGSGIFEALISKVPDDRFLMLDMATDYNRTWWKTSYNWDFYNGFYGKPWVWSVIPNMGGKTAMTGIMDYYANGRLEAQRSPGRGKLTGYGIATEGVENNEMLYELITDAGWVGATDSIDLESWMHNYALCRYGSYSQRDKDYHAALLKSVYGTFTDHPQFGWQVRGNIIGRGRVHTDSIFYEGVERLFSDAQALRSCSSPLYRYDLIEAAVMYVAGKAEVINSNIRRAVEAGNKPLALDLLRALEMLMMRMDRSLTAHPLYNLHVWETQAMSISSDAVMQKRNARNARRIVSVWYGDHRKREPVNDYACKLWAGLIRDYYLPRLVGTWKQRISGETFDVTDMENRFVSLAPELSPQPPLQDNEVVDFLVRLIADARRLAGHDINDGGDIRQGDWRESFFF